VKQILGSLWYKDKHKIYLNESFLIKIYFLVKKDSDLDMYSRTRAILKSLNVDQYAIADKFGIKQSSISLALNGKNEKTFLRIVALLEKEYGVAPADIFEEPKTISQGLQEQLAEIKAELAASREELKQVLEGMEELKGMLKK
jgi:transcriptional regulator with XRE-family HTH domain